GPIGKVLDGDLIRIEVNRNTNVGSLDLIGENGRKFSPEEGAKILALRPERSDLAPNEDLPDDTRLWAALQQAGGGTWGGCVFDADRIIGLLEAGKMYWTSGDIAPGKKG